MTLTTERLREIASSPSFSANPLSHEVKYMARELLANREAQPVAYAVFADNGNIRIWSTDKGITENVGVPVPLYTAQQAPEITDEAIDKIVVPLSPDGLDEEKHHCEWHLYHDRERIRKELREYFAAPPAQASEPIFFIEVEGDDWINAGRIPGSTFDFNNLPDGVNKLYAAPPAPAVNTAPDFEAWFNSPEAGLRVVNFHIQRELQVKAWEACCAAMLESVAATSSIPMISGGYKFPDGWIACSERMPTPFVDVIASDGKQTICAHVIEDRWWCIVSETAEEPGPIIFWMSLPAAPEGGNG